MAKILVLHGPNLDKLGQREIEHYGSQTLDSINQALKAHAQSLGHKLETFQSNAEHLMIQAVDEAKSKGVEFIVLNPAAWTHTSLALREAIAASALPFIEVHLSNIFARETFRHHSHFSSLAQGIITGLGPHGYTAALNAAHFLLTHPRKTPHGHTKD